MGARSDLEERAEEAHRGVVDADVASSELVEDGVDDPIDVVGHGQIGGHLQDREAEGPEVGGGVLQRAGQ